MIKNLLFISLTFFSVCASSQSFSATYGFANVSTTSGTIDPGPQPNVSGLEFLPFNANGVSTNPGASGRFSFNGWPGGASNGDDNYGNYAGVLSPFAYYEVRIAVAVGFTLDLNTIGFSVRRSGTGVRNYCLRSNLDGYTNNLAAATGTNSKLSVIPTDIFFWNFDSVGTSSDQKGSLVTLGAAFKGLTDTITFHFYAWNSEASGGSFGIDNVTFTGEVYDATISGFQKNALAGTAPEFNISPNPNHDGQLLIDHAYFVTRLELTTFCGVPIVPVFNPAWYDKIKLDLSGLANGIYFIRIYTGRAFTTRKLVLSR